MTDAPSPAAIDGPRHTPAGATDSLVILLHGYGASGDDLFGLAQPLSQILPRTAFASPNAPERCRVNPMGYQWFCIPWIDGSSETEMLEGFARAEATLNAFLDAEMARHGVSADRVALVGFSQGTMMSLHIGPRRDAALAGIVGFSGRLTAPEALAAQARSKPPVLLVHGDQDDVIPVDAIHEARDGLAAVDIPVRWHISRGVGHGIAPDGLQLAATFLKDALDGPT